MSAAQDQEPVLEPDLPIVDAHHHLWIDQRWSTAYVRDYPAADFLADAAGCNLAATVYVECGSAFRPDGPAHLRPVGETEFAAAAGHAAVGPTRLCAGIVGAADLRLGAAVGEVLDAHMAAGGGRFRGVRAQVTHVEDPAVPIYYRPHPPRLLADPALRAGAAELVRRGLSLDVWLVHPQLPELTALADALPDLTIVCNHVGGLLTLGGYGERPDRSFADWKAGLAEAARRPNVVLKLGGLGMRAMSAALIAEHRGHAASETLAAAWRPIFEACVETFGPARCVLESNFPVDKLAGGYRQTWNAYKRLSRGLSADERTALFSGTAAWVYRLEL
jgi:L-fuconolactonase